MPNPSSRNHQAFTLVYMAIAMAVLMGLASLCIDFGRAQLVKIELQRTADAAAQYAATGINDGTTLSKALASAAENKADGNAVTLTNADVTVGTWNKTTRLFTAGGSTPNSVRVVAQRTAARGTAVPTVFMQALGQRTVDVKATGIALFTPNPVDYDIIGLDGISLSGTSKIFPRADETTPMMVASNGSWTTTGSSVITGNVYYRGSNPTANITGTETLMSSNLMYPAVTLPGSYINLGSYSINAGTQSVDSANYYVTGLTIAGTSRFSIYNSNGPVSVYANGTVNISGAAVIDTGSNARKFYIYGMGNNTINISGDVNLYIMIYAPTCTVNLSGNARVYGSIVCKTLNMSGTSQLEYTSLNAPVAPSSGGVVAGSVSIVN